MLVQQQLASDMLVLIVKYVVGSIGIAGLSTISQTLLGIDNKGLALGR